MSVCRLLLFICYYEHLHRQQYHTVSLSLRQNTPARKHEDIKLKQRKVACFKAKKYTLHTQRQFVVDMCAEPHIPTKLFDSRDDKLTVSGLHKTRTVLYILNQNSKHKGMRTHGKSNQYNT